MQIQTNVPLKDYSTMRLGGPAKALVHITSKDELAEAVDWAEQHKLPWLVLGGGSNVIFSGGFDGLVIVNRIREFTVLKDDERGTTIHIGAGEIWDDVVAKSVAMGLHGLEFLSAIPGTVGGTPVQNVGAYGAQISDVFVELEAYDTKLKKLVTIPKADCGFGYRTSVFKSLENRRYIISCLTLSLAKVNPQPPFYDSLQRYLDEHHITDYTPLAIRQAVMAIRAVKLPDPSRMANTGSFFKNPQVTAEQAAPLLAKFPDLPRWPMPGGKVKLSAGWLIEAAGLKNYRAHGMKTYEHHALVVVNESAKSYQDLAAFRQEIIDGVRAKFDVTLEQEPELIEP